MQGLQHSSAHMQWFDFSTDSPIFKVGFGKKNRFQSILSFVLGFFDIFIVLGLKIEKKFDVLVGRYSIKIIQVHYSGTGPYQ